MEIRKRARYLIGTAWLVGTAVLPMATITIAFPPAPPSHFRRRTVPTTQADHFPLRFLNDASPTNADSDRENDKQKPVLPSSPPMVIWKVTQLLAGSMLMAMLLIGWEDLSMSHPMRSNYASSQQNQYLQSTVHGMAFGSQERQNLPPDIEPKVLQEIPSYNEVLERHRSQRIPKWKSDEISQRRVQDSVRTVQFALLHVLDCERLANEYNWEELGKQLRDPILWEQLDQACDILNRAKDYLSLDARSEVGFDFGSCAWRHCGAFADIREAIDELDHLIGVLEPFEANFVLDVAERGLRDILAVTPDYQDKSIIIPDYQLLQRRSSMTQHMESPLDADYLEALDFIKKMEQQE